MSSMFLAWVNMDSQLACVKMRSRTSDVGPDGRPEDLDLSASGAFEDAAGHEQVFFKL